MSPDEMWVRVIVLIPLAAITWQVILLRRILRSLAWNLIASGFVVFVIVRTTSLFAHPFPTIPGLVAFLVGYGLVAMGFYVLYRDLMRLLYGAERRADLPPEAPAEPKPPAQP